jgi:CheY-like chemotaxis protein
MRILIVDDNTAMRRLIREMVAELADDIEECENGQDAISVWDRCRPDLVLMDMHMKYMDGLEATRHICSRDAAAKVLILTDYDDSGLREAARAVGACDYQLKEDLLQLTQVIYRLIANKPP